MSAKFPIWHPFTQHAIYPEMTRIAEGEGAYLRTDDGRTIIDAISSWWVITHGHRHPRIVEAIREQAGRLDQVIFAGFTHEPAEKLAEHLLALTPDGIDHVFFSDSGSTSVEVALKMALGFWRNTGHGRTGIVVMDGGYHGDTIGTMSAGARGVFNQAYEPLLYDVRSIPFPSAGNEQDTLDALEKNFVDKTTAAFLVEPLLLGAGGMLMYPPEILREMRDICRRHGVLFIADEVATGWGRTGRLFACEHAGVTPDIVCYSKGITGGSLPLAVTMCTSEIFDAHYSPDRSRTFFHSSSYTANPIACAAALANMKIWQDEPVAERIALLAARQKAALARFEHDERFSNIRQLGTIAALDVRVGDEGYLAGIGPRLYNFFLSRNVLLRPLGNTIYVMPPYCLTQSDIDTIYDIIAEAADELL